MFGIDLGISVSSVTCISQGGKILDYTIIFGDKNKEEWVRITEMSDYLVDAIIEIGRSKDKMIIESLASIEEPVFPYRTRNPRSYFQLCCLYALLRNKLARRGFTIYSVNPLSVKATAKVLAFRNKKLKKLYAVKSKLTKKGMVRAFTKVTGSEPNYRNAVGKETLADSYFIARVGIDRRKVGINE